TRVRLTPAGMQFRTAVGVAFRNISETVRALPVVSLRVNVAAASLWLMPALGDFYASCPNIRLHLVCVDELPELGLENFDLEIRFGYGQWPDVESFPLLEEMVYPVAAPEFCRKHQIDTFDALAKMPLLQLSNFTSPLMDWKLWLNSA